MGTIVTNAGKGIMSARFLSTATALSLRIGWGTGAGTAAAADTTLFTEAPETRVAATMSQVTTDTTNDTIQAVGTLQASGTRTITNAGLFDAATSGNLIVKGDFAGIPLQLGDSIAFTIKIQFS